MTVSQAAEAFHKTSAYIYNLANSGRVRSAYSKEGVRIVESDDLAAIFAKRKGKRGKKGAVEGSGRSDGLAAAVFRCFGKGMSLRQIVQETQASPRYVRSLWREWNRPLESPKEEANNRILDEMKEDERRKEMFAHQQEMARIKAGKVPQITDYTPAFPQKTDYAPALPPLSSYLEKKA